jgi:hypothetical protein
MYTEGTGFVATSGNHPSIARAAYNYGLIQKGRVLQPRDRYKETVEVHMNNGAILRGHFVVTKIVFTFDCNTINRKDCNINKLKP